MTLSSPKVTETKPRRLPVSIIVTVGIWVLCTKPRQMMLDAIGQ